MPGNMFKILQPYLDILTEAFEEQSRACRCGGEHTVVSSSGFIDAIDTGILLFIVSICIFITLHS